MLKERQYPGNNNRLFGTSGIRGVVGQDLTVDFCREVARAIGTTLPASSRVCVATDTRVSRDIIREAVIAGLRYSGIDVTDIGILPTPALAFLTRDMGFDTGLMITASHNPPEFNGIKLFNGDSMGYSRVQEAEIERAYAAKGFRPGHGGILQQKQEAKERYFRFVLNMSSESDLNHNRRIVVDAGNGAASGFASELLSTAGFEVMPINDEPDGSFPGRSPEPGQDTLEGTVSFLRQRSADLALCFDGDADRVVFCDQEGFLGFDEVTTLISYLAVGTSGKKRVATTVETGRLLDLAVRHLGAEVARGMVGDVNVAYLARELDAAIGVEPVGVYIMPEAGYYPDSLVAALTLLSQMRQASDIRGFLRDLPRLYSGQRKLPCPNGLKAAVMERVMGKAGLLGAGWLNTVDGLRFEYDDAWILIRASGTEPVIRLLAESVSQAGTEDLLDRGVLIVESAREGTAA